jgi:hypothetical protein
MAFADCPHMSRSLIAIVLAALVAAPCSAAPKDSEGVPGSSSAAKAPLTYNGQPITSWTSSATATTDSDRELLAVAASDARDTVQYGYGSRRGHRNQAALTAIMLGAVGAIAGTAVLVYANRPECNVNPNLGGCGYGTKVVGASVLSGGVVGLMVGAVMWR